MLSTFDRIDNTLALLNRLLAARQDLDVTVKRLGDALPAGLKPAREILFFKSHSDQLNALNSFGKDRYEVARVGHTTRRNGAYREIESFHRGLKDKILVWHDPATGPWPHMRISKQAAKVYFDGDWGHDEKQAVIDDVLI